MNPGGFVKGLVKYGKTAADLILPRCCAVCGNELRIFEKHLCTECMADIPYTYNWVLPHNPMADRFNELIQNDICQNIDEGAAESPESRQYCHAAALLFFNSEASYRNIPYRIKYHGDLALGLFFGKMLGARLMKTRTFQDADTVIPVPLHWLRHWKRGYNQAEIIARGIASVTGAKVRNDILYRKRRTVTQTKLNVEEKAVNVKEAFSIRRNAVCNARHILIVDDVFTTGATLNECCKTVRKAVPEARISIATLALVSN